MAVIFEGNGFTFTYSGLTLSPKTIELPGWTKEDYDVSTLSNSAVKTKFVAALREYNKVFITTQFDFAEIENLPQANADLVITKAGQGTLTLRAEISELDPVTLENDAEPVYRIGFTITNRNASDAETAPAYATT